MGCVTFQNRCCSNFHMFGAKTVQRVCKIEDKTNDPIHELI